MKQENDRAIVGEFRLRHGLDDDFDRQVSLSFREEIADRFRNAFESHLQRTGRTWEDVGRALRVHRATVNRWVCRELKIDLSNIYIYLVSQDISVEELPLRRGYDVVLHSLADTMRMVRQRLVPGDTPASIRPDEVECLRFLARHPEMVENTKSNNSILLERILGDYYRSRPDAPRYNLDSVRRLLAKWFITWVVVTDALDYDWIRHRHEYTS